MIFFTLMSIMYLAAGDGALHDEYSTLEKIFRVTVCLAAGWTLLRAVLNDFDEDEIIN